MGPNFSARLGVPLPLTACTIAGQLGVPQPSQYPSAFSLGLSGP